MLQMHSFTKASGNGYMVQPKGFEDSTHPNHVCLLIKAIYGFKQASRQWYNTFTSYLVSLGFEHSKSDSSLLILKQMQANIFLLIYVDDILITWDTQDAIKKLLDQLNLKFAMKHLSEAHSFLGTQIKHQGPQYFLSQEQYAYSIIQQANLIKCNSVSNPTCTKLATIFQDNSVISDPSTYRKLT
ncbi:hypothetical protein KFK09_028305 [Dendrobium nobile]|uniref:Reverse transcriptase Ty1/copia-type domain-containing protein n=1 Tax=Dendrobium nobile TaxID=94219 RepID=A0A8T3A2Z7_DENNO|nr:hypothetical protein KFK09_028305 [Dendrobium nobile]